MVTARGQPPGPLAAGSHPWESSGLWRILEQLHLWQTACVSLTPGYWVSEGPDLGVLGCSSNSVHTFNLLGIAPIWPLLLFPTHPTFQPRGRGCSLHMALGCPPRLPASSGPRAASLASAPGAECACISVDRLPSPAPPGSAFSGSPPTVWSNLPWGL